MPVVAVIVLNWNGYEDTAQCLQSLRQVRGVDARIYLVDNGSSGDDVGRLSAEFDDLLTKLIANGQNLGFAEGNNVGIRTALAEGADYVLLLNNDTIVEPDALRELVAAAEADPAIGIVGPRLLNLHDPSTLQSAGGIVYWTLGTTRQRGFNTRDRGQYSQPEDVNWVSMACCLVRREVLDRVGLISTNYFLQWEDVDYCTRAIRVGYRCAYIPTARVHHRLSASFNRAGQGLSMVRRGWRNRVWFFRTHLHGLRYGIHTLAFGLLTLPSYVAYQLIVYRSLSRAKAIVKGLQDGFKPVGELSQLERSGSEAAAR